MLDLYVLLTPVVLLPIVLLFLFSGCTGEDPAPVSKGPDPGPATPPPAPTRVQLNLDRDLQKLVQPDDVLIRTLTVYWSLYKSGGLWTTVPLGHFLLTPSDPARDFLDPTQDAAPRFELSPADVAAIDHIGCSCDLVLRAQDPDSLESLQHVDSASRVQMVERANHVFALQGGQGTYSIVFESADGG